MKAQIASVESADDAPHPRSLSGLAKAEDACTRCPIYRNATQAVPGEGAAHAPLMLVGEQPGNDEDLAGHPFVGPAGHILDKALAEARIERKSVFVTNAVKHFKFEPRGKRRLHKRPNAYEIDRCRWWNDLERALVHPRLIVALGATAARSLMGKPIKVNAQRQAILAAPDGNKVLVTIHPSLLLRIRDQADKARNYKALVDDLVFARKFIAEHGAVH
jgi:DNA polymerase